MAKHYTSVDEILNPQSQLIGENGDVKLFFGDDKVACGGDFHFIYYDPICLVDSCGGNVYWWEVMDSAPEHHLSEEYISFESGCIQSPITEKKYPKRYATQEVALTFQHGGKDDPQPGAFINLAVFWDVMALLGKARGLDKYTEQYRMRKV